MTKRKKRKDTARLSDQDQQSATQTEGEQPRRFGWIPLWGWILIFVVPLVIIFGTIQALVFSLLSAVYIGLMLPGEGHH